MFFDRVLSWLYSALEKLIPVADHECFISFPDIDDSALSIYTELLLLRGRPSDKLIWLASDKSFAISRLKARLGFERAREIHVSKKNSLPGLWRFLRARRVYFTHGHYRFVRRGVTRLKLVNLWHGMPLKAIGTLDGKDLSRVQASDLTIASSDFFRPIMAKAFGLTDAEVLVTGLPRCDQLARSPSPMVRNFRESLLVDADRLVIWMPTYRFSTLGDVRTDSRLTRNGCIEEFMGRLASLSMLAANSRCALLVKLHPMDFLNQIEFSEFENVTLLRANSAVFESFSLYELLAAADGLITDVSSVCFDFMVNRRPILITREFTKEYTRELLFDPELLFSMVFTTGDGRGAADFFDAVGAGQTLALDARAQFCKFSDSQSSSRVVDSLIALDAKQVAVRRQ